MKQISQEPYDALQKEFGTKQSRFIDNGDGTITDTKERLMWENTPRDEEFTWEEAMELKNDLAGYTDWRLPTIHELFTLVDFSKDKGMRIDDVFNVKDQSAFWSATTDASKGLNGSFALSVIFSYGVTYSSSKTNSLAIRCVRQI